VDTFVRKNSLVRPNAVRNGIAVHNESYSANEALGMCKNDLKSLALACNVSADNAEVAAKTIGMVIGRYFQHGNNATGLLDESKKVAKSWSSDARVLSNNDIFARSSVEFMDNFFHMEDFGLGMSTTVADLRMAIGVAVMHFHQGIASRMFHTVTTTEPIIQYKREEMKVYELGTKELEDYDLIDLHRKPSPVSNALKPIIVSTENDSDTDPGLRADGIIRAGAKVNILDLSIDESMHGYGQLNRTDLVADGARVDKVYVSLTATVDTAPVTERFVFTVPPNLSRMVIVNNGAHTALRGATISMDVKINKNTPTAAGTASVIFADLDAAEGLHLNIRVNPELSLRNGDFVSTCAVYTVPHHDVTKGVVSAELQALFADIMTSELTRPYVWGLELDAKFSEENMRKSNIAGRIQTRPFVWHLPPARNYLIDTTIQQPEEDNGIQFMSSLVGIGTDDATMMLLLETIDLIAEMTSEMKATEKNPLNPAANPGFNYVAGAKVRPRVIRRSLTLDDVASLRDSDRASDIRENALMKIGYLFEELHLETMITKQLPGGMRPVYRGGMSPKMLNAIFSAPHIHNHLNKHTGPPALDGVEYTLVLNTGVTLEISTSMFDYMDNIAAFVPVIPNDPASDLNYGVIHSHSVTSGSYQVTEGGAVHNRAFTADRRCLYPTNPMALLLQIPDLDAVFRLDD
jgi:hypothetical protein